MKTLDARKIDASADREITFPLGPSLKGHMKGADYLNHFALPNFYFHLTTAYDILRHRGVEIGKRDFLGHPNEDHLRHCEKRNGLEGIVSKKLNAPYRSGSSKTWSWIKLKNPKAPAATRTADGTL